MSKIMLLPDVQAKPGVCFNYLTYAGMYAADKKPDVIVCIGDFADMPSLSSYDRGKKSFEGRRYINDINAAKEAMQAFLGPIRDEQTRLRKNKEKGWNPRMVMTLGNHESRITRAAEEDPKLEGLVKLSDLSYELYGWEVYPFLEPVIIEDIAFCHYFTSGLKGLAISSAPALLAKKHMSCVAGHQQGRQIAYAAKADGTQITSMILGSFYEHDEDYLGPQGNKHWRGFSMLHECHKGSFDEMLVSINFLKEKYGTIRV